MGDWVAERCIRKIRDDLIIPAFEISSTFVFRSSFMGETDPPLQFLGCVMMSSYCVPEIWQARIRRCVSTAQEHYDRHPVGQNLGCFVIVLGVSSKIKPVSWNTYSVWNNIFKIFFLYGFL
jgi:hypothetical protein